MLTADQLLTELIDRACNLTAAETIPTEAALGRVLAATQISTINVPPLDNSAMDGYAVRAAECLTDCVLPVSQRILAGQVGEPLQIGSVARIFTGAPIPDGADAVVMQEYCRAEGNTIQLLRPVHAGENIRRSGEDIVEGNTILELGTRLHAAHMGLAASVGLAELPVFRRLKVASFSTGDELAQPGIALQAGQIYNSNRYTLSGLIQALGCEWIDLGAIPDTLSATVTALQRATMLADVIISSGGVSVGEADHIKAAVAQLGVIELWKVAMKPGKPLAYGRIDNTDFIGLPGNPVSAFTTFCLFARPFLLKRMGATQILPIIYQVRAASAWLHTGSRREFLRARIQQTDHGEPEVLIFSQQGSGVLASVVWANGFVDLAAGETINIGDRVRFIPFNEVT
ncbi:MAG: molybdopterin molybdotransferase MoeA [Sulfuriferula sp.]